MSNYWAIAIGINQYQHFQPLLYAQWDAQALWNYWVKEGGIPHTQCVLLTDQGAPGAITPDSGMPGQQSPSPLPIKKTIEQQLIDLGHHRLRMDDTLWCFFSGYGIHSQGKDYLMPLDGDPKNPAQTGISAESFFAALGAFPTDRIVVLLDLKRSPNHQGPDVRLGEDIAQQAQNAGIATLIASKPDQQSHETLTLRQGLFTATILEGLRTHGCFQLSQLVQYVENRLPELSEYHWRPRQEPTVVVTSDQGQRVLLAPSAYQTGDSSIGQSLQPERQPATVGLRSGKSPSLKSPSLQAPTLDRVPDGDRSGSMPSPGTPVFDLTLDPPLSPLKISAEDGGNPFSQPEDTIEGTPVDSLPGLELPFASESLGASLSESIPDPGDSTSSGSRPNGQLNSQPVGTVELPVLGNELSYKPVARRTSVKSVLPPELKLSSPAPSPERPVEDPPETIPIEDGRTPADDEANQADGSNFWKQCLQYGLPLLALMMLVLVKLNWPALTRQPQVASTDSSPNLDISNPVVVNSEGQTDAEGNGVEGAIAPPDASSPVTFPVEPDGGNGSTPPGDNPLESGTPESDAGPDVAGPDSAVTFPDPVNEDAEGTADEASDAPPDEKPGFFPGLFGSGNGSDGQAGDALTQAKASMEIGDYEDAILWLDQVPPEAQTAEYERVREDAEQARSQSGQANQAILDQALASLNEAREETAVNQASDFGRAIAIANQIQSGQPIYDEAQGYVVRWGEVILDLAQARAQSGDYEQAIATANLIEEDIPTLYPKAQRLISQWQSAVGIDDSSQNSQTIIEAAKRDITIQPDQAFPYNRGIGKLRDINPGEPQYEEAQQLIDEWSQKILDIATARARRGDRQLAIDTAQYVPYDTAAYAAAQDAIKRWNQ